MRGREGSDGRGGKGLQTRDVTERDGKKSMGREVSK